ncbi:MAG: type II toxin-antitoxin system Phd/YefM family antitoxin [Trebonia sp.]
MAVMTISEARAALPDVVNRVADGEEVTITRYGRPAAVLVRPDIVWSRPATEVIMSDIRELAAALGERARRHGLTLAQELDAILRAAEEGARPAERPAIRLTTVRTAGGSTWSRTEIYGDEGR